MDKKDIFIVFLTAPYSLFGRESYLTVGYNKRLR